MNAKDLIERLRIKYPTDKGEWATFEELSMIGSGRGRGVERRIDFIALGLWSSSGFRTVSVEVKVSRSDWLSELDRPEKREVFETKSNEFWIAADKGVVNLDELPDGVGLFEPYGRGLRRKRPARYFRDRSPSEALLRQMVKRSQKTLFEEQWKRQLVENEYASLRGKPISLAKLRRIQKNLAERYEVPDRVVFGVDKKNREERKKTLREWMDKWDGVFYAIHRAMKRTGESPGYRPSPEKVEAWLERQVAPKENAEKGANLASELRHLADRLDPPATE